MRPLLQVHNARVAGYLLSIRNHLPGFNFITIHYAYFILTSLFFGLIFWLSSTPFGSVQFIDAYFLCVSAMTEAGLNTVNLSTLNTWQQVMLLFLIMAGSAIFVSIFVVFVRLTNFEPKFKEARARERARDQQAMAKRHNLKSIVLRRSRTVPNPMESKPAITRLVTDEKRPVSDSVQVPNDVRVQFKTQGELSLGRPRSLDSMAITDGPEYQDLRLEGAADRDSRARGRPEVEMTPPRSPTHSRHPSCEPRPQIKFGPDSRPQRSISDGLASIHRPLISFSGVGAASQASPRPRSNSLSISRQALTSADSPSPADGSVWNSWGSRKSWPTWLSTGYMGRNSQFFGLSTADRLRLGGYEYRAVLFLSFMVPVYFVIWQLLGALALGAWINQHRASVCRENGQNPWWVGSFNAVSAFNNSGMSLLDANVTAFQDAVFVLLSMGLFILAGNTAYPIFLRIAIWAMYKILPENDAWKNDRATLRFLLLHPRRCYTNLFPARQTWWLGGVLIVLNAVDWAAFEILNIGNGRITILDPGIEAVDGLFQALAVRAGGFYVVPIPNIRVSLQVLYVFMMYISAYPVTMTMRGSNVYEERSLGIFPDEDGGDGEAEQPDAEANAKSRFGGLKRRVTALVAAPRREKRTLFLRQQVRAQLSHDMWWIVLAIFLIMIIEGSQFERDPVNFSVFNVIFEVVSAYATVGISVGVPDAAYSFSGSWHKLSKLILIAVMIRGRHRGLPVALDHAVQLPGSRLTDTEEDDGASRIQRTQSFRADI